jgi:hypothetical protein
VITEFKENIPGFENVANLDQLPPTGSYEIALPMKIRDGSGAPLRIISSDLRLMFTRTQIYTLDRKSAIE